MSWLEKLRPASFRGVPFYVEDTKKTLGRRAVLHEFPNRETPYTQDMGRISYVWTMDCHVVGKDYDQEKAKLQDAFNKYGPGELIHPYDGLQRVQVGAVEFGESTKEGAILRFTVTFYEAGTNEFPAGLNNKKAILGEAAQNALEKSKSVFDKAFSIAKLPGFAVSSARAAIASAKKSYDEASKGVSDVAEQATKLAYSTKNLVAETNDLLSSPSKLSQRLLDSFSLLENSISKVNLKTAAYAAFYSFGAGDPSVTGSTPVRVQEAANQKAFNNFVRQAAVVNSAVTAQQTEFETSQEAEAKRDEIVAVLEEQIRETSDTELYQALMDVKAAVIDSIPDSSYEVPSLKKVETKDETNTLILAYELFNDPSKESDIISRNKIANPGIIPKGAMLEVLDV